MSSYHDSQPPSTERFPAPVRWASLVMLGMLGATIYLIALASNEVSRTAFEGPVRAVPEATAELVSSSLPLEVNEQVDRWIRRFIGKDRASFEAYLVRGRPVELDLVAAAANGRHQQRRLV